MRLTPGYLTAVATFYDMLDTEPVGRHRVYVCTNISCSLNGADALYERLHDAVGDDDPDFNVRHFECLGACDIAPMASVDGVYVGPIALDEVDRCSTRSRDGGRRCPTSSCAPPHASTDPRRQHAASSPQPDARARRCRRARRATAARCPAGEGPVAPIEQAPGGPAQSDRPDRSDPSKP